MTSKLFAVVLSSALAATSPAIASPRTSALVVLDDEANPGLPSAAESANELVEMFNGTGAVVSHSLSGKESHATAGKVVNAEHSANGQFTMARASAMTETMVVTLVMQEVEKGTWTLDQPISEIMPDIDLARTDVTLRQLVGHTSGIPNWYGARPDCSAEQTLINDDTRFKLPDGSDFGDGPKEAAFERFVSARWTTELQFDWASQWNWVFEPGTNFCFSLTNHLVVGELLEYKTGKTLDDLLTHQIFRPAGMPLATFEKPLTGGSAARSYLQDIVLQHKDGKEISRFDASGFDMSVVGASGAVSSRMVELNRFHRALHGGKLISASSLKEMKTTNPLALGDCSKKGELGYGLGMQCEHDGTQVLWGHTGTTGGTMTRSYSNDDGSTIFSSAVSGYKLPEDDDSVEESSALAVSRLEGVSHLGTTPLFGDTVR